MLIKHPEVALDEFMSLWYEGDRSYPKMLHLLCSYVAWTEESLCMIRNVKGQIIPLKLKKLQRILIGSMMVQAAMGLPIRIVILKYRQGGCTTGVQSLDYYICAHVENQVSLMMAHKAKSTVEIFEIAKLIDEKYDLVPSNPGAEIIKFPNTRSRYYCATAGGAGAGAGSTTSLLHISEYALCDDRTKKTLYTSLNAIPDEPTTIVVKESTARGQDEFWDAFNSARNDQKHPYVSIFVPWFMEDRYKVALKPGETLRLTEYERWLVGHARDQYEIDVSQEALKWRRVKIKDVGADTFRQEYPATPEEAIQGNRSLILPNMRSCVIDKLPFKAEMVPFEFRVGGGDHGHNDPTVLMAGFYLDQILYIISVYHAVGKIGRDHAKHVKDGHTYYCDPSGLSDREEIIAELPADSNAILRPAPRMTDARKKNTHTDPEWAAVKKGVMDGKIKILASCADQIILEADSFEWNPKTGKPNDERKPGAWYHFDCLCTIRYMYVGCLLAHHVSEGVALVKD